MGNETLVAILLLFNLYDTCFDGGSLSDQVRHEEDQHKQLYIGNKVNEALQL